MLQNSVLMASASTHHHTLLCTLSISLSCSLSLSASCRPAVPTSCRVLCLCCWWRRLFAPWTHESSCRSQRCAPLAAVLSVLRLPFLPQPHLLLLRPPTRWHASFPPTRWLWWLCSNSNFKLSPLTSSSATCHSRSSSSSSNSYKYRYRYTNSNSYSYWYHCRYMRQQIQIEASRYLAIQIEIVDLSLSFPSQLGIARPLPLHIPLLVSFPLSFALSFSGFPCSMYY